MRLFPGVTFRHHETVCLDVDYVVIDVHAEVVHVSRLDNPTHMKSMLMSDVMQAVDSGRISRPRISAGFVRKQLGSTLRNFTEMYHNRSDARLLEKIADECGISYAEAERTGRYQVDCSRYIFGHYAVAMDGTKYIYAGRTGAYNNQRGYWFAQRADDPKLSITNLPECLQVGWSDQARVWAQHVLPRFIASLEQAVAHWRTLEAQEKRLQQERVSKHRRIPKRDAYRCQHRRGSDRDAYRFDRHVYMRRASYS